MQTSPQLADSRLLKKLTSKGGPGGPDPAADALERKNQATKEKPKTARRNQIKPKINQKPAVEKPRFGSNSTPNT
jgi:hypothetical protein